MTVLGPSLFAGLFWVVVAVVVATFVYEVYVLGRNS